MTEVKKVWVVEMWNDERGRWEPTMGAALTKERGLDVAREWRVRNPHDRFRIAKYFREA